MSEGQDERETAMHAAWRTYLGALTAPCPQSTADFEAGYWAALAGSEARERELERNIEGWKEYAVKETAERGRVVDERDQAEAERNYAKEGQLSWKKTAERAERLRSDTELRCEGLRAREVLVEALKEAFGTLEHYAGMDDGESLARRSARKLSAALAGVVEAEPDGRTDG